MDVTFINNHHNEFVISYPSVIDSLPDSRQSIGPKLNTATMKGQCVVTDNLYYGSIIRLSEHFPAISRGLVKICSIDISKFHPVYNDITDPTNETGKYGCLCDVMAIGTVEAKVKDSVYTFYQNRVEMSGEPLNPCSSIPKIV